MWNIQTMTKLGTMIHKERVYPRAFDFAVVPAWLPLLFGVIRTPAGGQGRLHCVRTPPRRPPWTSGTLRPLLHHPERDPSSVEAGRGSRSAPQAVPKRRMCSLSTAIRPAALPPARRVGGRAALGRPADGRHEPGHHAAGAARLALLTQLPLGRLLLVRGPRRCSRPRGCASPLPLPPPPSPCHTRTSRWSTRHPCHTPAPGTRLRCTAATPTPRTRTRGGRRRGCSSGRGASSVRGRRL